MIESFNFEYSFNFCAVCDDIQLIPKIIYENNVAY